MHYSFKNRGTRVTHRVATSSASRADDVVMENGGSNHGGPGRRASRQSSHVPETVRLEGRDVYPARVEGNHDVFRAPMFVLTKARFVEIFSAIMPFQWD